MLGDTIIAKPKASKFGVEFGFYVRVKFFQSTYGSVVRHTPFHMDLHGSIAKLFTCVCYKHVACESACMNIYHSTQ